MKSIAFCSVSLMITCWLTNGAKVYPGQYLSFLDQAIAVNGSSIAGNCSDIDNITSACTEPRNSVLFDGIIPELTGLDGDMWASQLLVTPSTLRTRYALSVLAFYFTANPDYTGVERVEMAIFNCPEWGASIGTIAVQEFTNGRVKTLAIHSISTTSCDSLVRVCVPVSTNSTVIPIMFYSVPAPEFFVHLAEVTFYANSSTCPPEAIISADPVTTQGSPDPTTVSGPNSSHAPCPTQSGGCPSCATSNSWASVSTAIGTALLATAILTFVQIAICKSRAKLRARECETEDQASQVSERPPYAVQNNGAYIRSIKMERNNSYIENTVYCTDTDTMDTNTTDTNTVHTDTTNTINLTENEAYCIETHTIDTDTNTIDTDTTNTIDLTQNEAYCTGTDTIDTDTMFIVDTDTTNTIDLTPNEAYTHTREVDQKVNSDEIDPVEAYVNTQSDNAIELEQNQAYVHTVVEDQVHEDYITDQSADTIELEQNEAYIHTVHLEQNERADTPKLDQSNAYVNTRLHQREDTIELEQNEAYIKTPRPDEKEPSINTAVELDMQKGAITVPAELEAPINTASTVELDMEEGAPSVTLLELDAVVEQKGGSVSTTECEQPIETPHISSIRMGQKELEQKAAHTYVAVNLELLTPGLYQKQVNTTEQGFENTDATMLNDYISDIASGSHSFNT